MAEISKALGLGSTFDFNGKSYTCSPWTYRIQGEFEQYLESHAMKTVKKMRQYLTESEYGELVAKTHKDIAEGYYAFGSEPCMRAMQTLTHFKKVLHICLLPKHPDIDMNTVDELVQNRLEEMMAKVGEANSDPNPNGPEITTDQIAG
jgi:hypothetical protein